MTTTIDSNNTNSSEPVTMILQLTTSASREDYSEPFDTGKRAVIAIVAVIVYLALVGFLTLACWLYKSRSYNSASTSNIHDAIFSVHFSAAAGDVRLPTPLNADDRQRLDADFNAPTPTEDDDICPYATFAEIQQLQAATTKENGSTDSGFDAAERRRTRPRKPNDARQRMEPERRPANNDLNALYAQPHKLLAQNATSSATDSH